MPPSNLLHSEVTDKNLQGFYHVYNTLGHGFLEKVYENALALTLRREGFEVGQQVPVKVYFEGDQVGDYYADLIVAGRVIVELKAAVALSSAHEAQLVNYLKATDIEVGLLVNFGETPEFRRKVFTNDRKKRVGGGLPEWTTDGADQSDYQGSDKTLLGSDP
jgi:GxxExxY protein